MNPRDWVCVALAVAFVAVCLLAVFGCGGGYETRSYCDGPNLVYERSGPGVAVSPNDPRCPE